MKKFFKIIFTLVLLISSFGCNKEEVSSSEEINLVKLEELSEYSWISELNVEDIEYIEFKDVKWVYEIYVSYNQTDFEKIIDLLDCYVEVAEDDPRFEGGSGPEVQDYIIHYKDGTSNKFEFYEGYLCISGTSGDKFYSTSKKIKMDKFNFDFLYCELKNYGNLSIYENGEYVGIYEGIYGKKCLPYEGVIEGEVIRTLEDYPVKIKIYENNIFTITNGYRLVFDVPYQLYNCEF